MSCKIARSGIVVALACAAFGAAWVFAVAGGEIPRAPERWVTDQAGMLSPGTVSQLDAELESYERSSGHQIIVFIGKTTGRVPVDDWAVQAFEAWKIGRKGLDDGLAVIVMAEDRRIRIEVGYGLEPDVTDAVASRVIHEIMAPAMAAGENDRAVREGVAALMQAAGGPPGAGGLPVAGGVQGVGSRTTPGQVVFHPTRFQKVLIGLAILAFLVLLITHPSLAIWLLINILSGSGRGGGGFGSGGGGFTGGGGRSGGGGASGSW